MSLALQVIIIAAWAEWFDRVVSQLEALVFEVKQGIKQTMNLAYNKNCHFHSQQDSEWKFEPLHEFEMIAVVPLLWMFPPVIQLFRIDTKVFSF